MSEGKGITHIAPHWRILLLQQQRFCVTDRKGVQPRPQFPSPHPRTLTCHHTAIRSPGLPFNGLHPEVYVITCTTTYLPTKRDGKLSWPGWLTHRGQFTHNHRSGTGHGKSASQRL